MSYKKESPSTETTNVNSIPRYVVVREGYRVSSEEYFDKNDPNAIQELEFWMKVANNHSWGEPVEIVPYNNQLHRVW